jgi:hypothetical protein
MWIFRIGKTQASPACGVSPSPGNCETVRAYNQPSGKGSPPQRCGASSARWANHARVTGSRLARRACRDDTPDAAFADRALDLAAELLYKCV